MRVVFHPLARGDVLRTARYYREIDPALARAFVARLREVQARAASRPQTGAVIAGSAARRMRFKQFPHAMVYVVAGEELRVLAVAHDRRDPSFWRRRK